MASPRACCATVITEFVEAAYNDDMAAVQRLCDTHSLTLADLAQYSHLGMCPLWYSDHVGSFAMHRHLVSHFGADVDEARRKVLNSLDQVALTGRLQFVQDACDGYAYTAQEICGEPNLLLHALRYLPVLQYLCTRYLPPATPLDVYEHVLIAAVKTPAYQESALWMLEYFTPTSALSHNVLYFACSRGTVAVVLRVCDLLVGLGTPVDQGDVHGCVQAAANAHMDAFDVQVGKARLDVLRVLVQSFQLDPERCCCVLLRAIRQGQLDVCHELIKHVGVPKQRIGEVVQALVDAGQTELVDLVVGRRHPGDNEVDSDEEYLNKQHRNYRSRVSEADEAAAVAGAWLRVSTKLY